MRKNFILFILSVILISCTDKSLQTCKLTDSCTLVFLDSLSAAKFVTSEDDYTKRLSPWDRSAGMNTDSIVSQSEYLEHTAKNVIPWTNNEIKRFTSFAQNAGVPISDLRLNLPQKILLIKTTSNEFGGVVTAYTRQNAIMFAQGELERPDSSLYDTFIHEIFHVYSRHNAQKREALYLSIGFEKCNEMTLPDKWNKRRLTNPDAPALNTIIKINNDGEIVVLTPLIYTRNETYDITKPGGIFQGFSFRLMRVKEENNTWQPLLKDGEPVLYSPQNLQGFWDKIGKNTNYIIHPEEIMASNFVLLVTGKKDLPNPEIVENMKKIIAE